MKAPTFDESGLIDDEVVVYVQGRPDIPAFACTLVKSRNASVIRVQWPDKSAGLRWASPGPIHRFDAATGARISGSKVAVYMLSSASRARANAYNLR